jgi:Bifunctional DNA primase/polymerase, N-terminal/Primase C terminal 1 (PriCT-1)/AAA domain
VGRVTRNGRVLPYAEAAHAYSGLGWALVPCDGKAPRGRDWQRTQPMEPDLAAGKWSQWGERWNLGIVLGPSGLAVLDVDRDDAEEAVVALLGELPETPICRTGSDRLHVYFRDPGGLEKRTRDGFELRVGAHQVIAPPSVHPDTGKAYGWLKWRAPGDVALAPLPPELIAYFAAGEDKRGPAPEIGETIPEGTRNEALASLAGSMRRRGASEAEIRAALKVANRDRCRPPLPAEDVERVARSIARYKPDTPSPGLDARAASATHSWQPVDLVECAANPPAPPSVGELTYAGLRHLWFGEPESLKTWAAAALAAAETVDGRTAVYVDLENGAGAMGERLRALGLDDVAIRRLLYIAPSEPLKDPTILADVSRLLFERNASLVVLDSFDAFLSLHDLDPNSTTEVERFWREVVGPLRAHGAAVVLLDHVVKSKGARSRFPIGSQRKLGGADVALGFELVTPFGRGRTGLARIVVHKDRPGHLTRPLAADLEMTSDPSSGAVSWALRRPTEYVPEDAFRPTRLMEKVSRFIEAHVPEERPTMGDVERGVTGKRDYVRQAVARLLAEGFLKEDSGPRGARYLTSVKPYREVDDADA